MEIYGRLQDVDYFNILFLLDTSIFYGEQIVDPINECCIDCACLGNHDLVKKISTNFFKEIFKFLQNFFNFFQDLGLERSGELNARCNFPWLLSNVVNINGKRFVCTHEYHIIRRKGWRIGVIGLAEHGWLSSLRVLDVEQIIFEDYVQSADRLSEMLSKKIIQKNSKKFQKNFHNIFKQIFFSQNFFNTIFFNKIGNDYKCNFVIALTHMRVPNDKHLADRCKDIDLILGGHDHVK